MFNYINFIKYNKGNKTKTFDSDASINIFTGASAIYNGDFEYRPASEKVFYEMTLKYPCVKYFFIWDDGTQMDYYDWIGCVKYLITNFS